MKTIADEIIQKARYNRQKSLSEHESKKLLACYGIPTAAEILATTAEEAVAASKTIGFPLAMKACSAELMHKTESGGVALNVSSTTDLQQVFERLNTIEPKPDGILVQAMVPGKRELVVGLNRDAQFGPCVMLGLGGVFAEILDDIAFRAAPFDRVEALDMVSELRCSKIFGEFRGEPRADLNNLATILTAMGEIAIAHDQIAEIDINPLIINTDGQCVAADALVVLDEHL